MRPKTYLSLLMLWLSACGGGERGDKSAIEGTWRGEVIQGVILCSDGTGIGAGAGSVTRQVSLEVSGSDVVGSIVEAVDGTCYFEGIREADGFRADAISGCDQGLSSIRFTLLENGSAALAFNYDLNLVPVGANGIRCKATPEARITR
jgi:hypothetical protein